MKCEINYKPEGHNSVSPYLMVHDAANAIEFYKKAFNAVELFRMPGANGKIGHAEIKIGDTVVMLADEVPEAQCQGPISLKGTAVMLHVYVDDVDAIFKQAVSGGATIIREVQDQFYGDRSGGIRDPYGHVWFIATHQENVSIEELSKRSKGDANAAL